MSETVRKDSEWALPSAAASHARSAGTFASPAQGPAGAASKSSSTDVAPGRSPTAGESPGQSPGQSPGRPVGSRPLSVLVVEDDRTARRAVTQILKRQGYTVSEAGTVAEAVELLARRPDWVLLDLMLPDGCGTEVLRRAREAGGRRGCVVPGCGPDRSAAARARGPEGPLCKPLDVGRLLSLLEV